MSFHLLCKSFIILLLACFCLGCFCFGFYSLVNWVYCFLGSQVQRNYIVHSLENFPHKYMHTVPQRADNESARQAKTFENLHYTFQLFVIASMRFVYCIKYAIYIVLPCSMQTALNNTTPHHAIYSTYVCASNVSVFQLHMLSLSLTHCTFQLLNLL